MDIFRSRVDAITYFCTYFNKRLYVPILRNHPNLGLLVAGLHVHEKPILSR